MPNAEALAINQDAAGKPFVRLDAGGSSGFTTGTVILGKPLADGDWGLILLNNGAATASVACDASCRAAMSKVSGWAPAAPLDVRDLWLHKQIATRVTGALELAVDGGGASRLLRVTA